LSRTPLLLVGAGGLGRETLELVRAINAAVPTWDVVGVLDDDPRLHGQLLHGVPVLGPSETAHDRPEALVAATVASPGDPLRRVALVARLNLPVDRFATLVHPAAVVADSASVGPGSILHAGTVLTADIDLGRHVVAMPSVIVTHDDVIEDGVTLAAAARLAGGVTVRQGAYVGSGAMLREGIVVGAGAVIGMGSVVTRSVPAGELWVGVPARPHGAAGRRASS
jgi:sugar O-acyltransferase (sialic acid O-acetyltransferase NeuD family)